MTVGNGDALRWLEGGRVELPGAGPDSTASASDPLLCPAAGVPAVRDGAAADGVPAPRAPARRAVADGGRAVFPVAVPIGRGPGTQRGTRISAGLPTVILDGSIAPPWRRVPGLAPFMIYEPPPLPVVMGRVDRLSVVAVAGSDSLPDEPAEPAGPPSPPIPPPSGSPDPAAPTGPPPRATGSASRGPSSGPAAGRPDVAVPAPRQPVAGNMPPVRPRIVDDTGILGLSRRSRSRVGSRLFTWFFVAVFALIAIQMVVSLLDV